MVKNTIVPRADVNRGVVAIIQRADVAAQLRTFGFDYGAMPAEEFARYVAKELTTWGSVIKEAGIRAD